jgi:hypothetical protein
MIVTPAQAGVQFKNAWIPTCAGMTGGQYPSPLKIILEILPGHKTIGYFKTLSEAHSNKFCYRKVIFS